jgi:hypothetical protein
MQSGLLGFWGLSTVFLITTELISEVTKSLFRFKGCFICCKGFRLLFGFGDSIPGFVAVLAVVSGVSSCL